MSTLNDLGSISTNLRDRAHAAKIFIDGNHNLAPKFGFLYYVHIESIMPDVSKDIGMLVKSATLPKFSIRTQDGNAYNRTIYTQTRITYEPVNITFHDDNANTVRDFWRNYFSYYYRDTDNSDTNFAAMNYFKYTNDRQFNNWGYTPIRPDQDEPFLKKITIYSLHKKRFSAYSLMNPLITSFQHGEHAAGQNELMSHSMTITYESVLYREGKVTNDEPGFLNLFYDKHPSPLTPAGGGTSSITGQGGILETIGDIGSDIEKGDIGAAIFKGVHGIKNLGKMDLKNAATSELLEIGKSILQGNDPTKNIFVPNLSGSSDSKLGGIFNLGNTLKQGVSGASKLFSSTIGSIGKSSASKISQEISDSTTFLTKSFPTNASKVLPAIGSFSLFNFASLTEVQKQTTNLLATDVENFVSSQNTSGDVIQLNQVSQIKTPTQQGSMNETQLKTTIQYNKTAANRAKLDLQIEINVFKEQQQMAQDAIINLISKQNSLGNSNNLLKQQLEMQIKQQQAVIDDNELNINNSTVLIEKLDERIKMLDAKLSGLL